LKWYYIAAILNFLLNNHNSNFMQQTQAISPDTVIRKLSQSYATWFQPSKSFVLLEEPAYDVLRLYTEGQSADRIISLCTDKYGHLEENIPAFTNEMIEMFQHFNHPENAVSVSLDHSVIKSVPASVFSVKTYKIGDKTVSVQYQNEFLESSIHPLFAHLADSVSPIAAHKIELFENSRFFFFRYNGQIVDVFKKKHLEYFTGSVKQQIYSTLYNRDYSSWMMALHASGIIKNNQAILFSAAGGSGKSTISAMLKAHGYGYLSDDFIAADENGAVYPFPAAISVKEGAAERLSEFYPELKEMNSERAFTGKQVRYLPVHNQDEISEAPYPVKALVFVSYKKSAPFVFEEVEKKEALQILLEETWVNPKAENVSRFFSWVDKTPFFRLQYSETAQALEATEKLFAR
jgi:hypothetical protein